MAGTEAQVSATELRCPNCGAPWTLRGFATTRTLACEHCGAVIDTSGEAWQLVEKVEKAHRTQPRYALGSRGTLDGVQWEVIGWVRRFVRSFGVRYAWEEHLLYNPYEGFAYLIYQDGHFVFVRQVPGAPSTSVNRATYQRRTFRHFSTGQAEVEEVLGEFPWEVRRGDVATATDYVAPPHILSSEESAGELVWSEGRYVEPAEVFEAFGKPTRKVRSRKGIHPCQPNPFRAQAKWMAALLALALAAWFVLSMGYAATRDGELLWRGTLSGTGTLAPELTVADGPAILEISGTARQLSNQWTYLEMMLVGPLEEREDARFLGLEIEYYYGSDWSEGSRDESIVVAGVPAGRYLLQVKPMDRAPYKGPIDLSVTRDVVLWRYPICSLLLVLAVPAFCLVRAAAFETKRWSESDHAPSG